MPACSGLNVVFFDDFNTMDNWVPWDQDYVANNELQEYDPSVPRVEDSKLILEATYDPHVGFNGDTFDYTSGLVRSTGVTFEQGQRISFKAEMVIPDTSDDAGLWPAVWAFDFYGGYSWPQGGEIDFMEWVSTQPTLSHQSAHWLNSSNNHEFWTSGGAPADLTNACHVYAFDWLQDELIWYINGVQVASVDPNTFDMASSGNPFTTPGTTIDEITINLAVGGDWPGTPGTTAVPSQFCVYWLMIEEL